MRERLRKAILKALGLGDYEQIRELTLINSDQLTSHQNMILRLHNSSRNQLKAIELHNQFLKSDQKHPNLTLVNKKRSV